MSNRSIKRALSLVLSGLVLGLGPGLEGYRAAAQSVAASAADAGGATPGAAGGGILSGSGGAAVSGNSPDLGLHLGGILPVVGAAPAARASMRSTAGAVAPSAAPNSVAPVPASFGRKGLFGFPEGKEGGISDSLRASKVAVAAFGAPAASRIAAPANAAAAPVLPSADAPSIPERGSLEREKPPRNGSPRTALEALRLPQPDYAKLGGAEIKAEAGDDFLARAGETLSRRDRTPPANADRSMPGLFSSMRERLERKAGSPRPGGDAGTASRLGLAGPSAGGKGNPRKSASVVEAGGRAALGVAAGLALAPGDLAARWVLAGLYLALIVPSMVLHEMAHGWVAELKGDPTPRLQGRLSFRLRDLRTHIDPLWTLGIPLGLILSGGWPIGGARVLKYNPGNFPRPDRDEALLAAAGPATNAGLAALGAAAHAILGAAGVAGFWPWLAANFVVFNAMLALFNLIPLHPLDGHHVARWLLADVLRLPRAAAFLDRHAVFQLAVLVTAVYLLRGPLASAVGFVARILAGGP